PPWPRGRADEVGHGGVPRVVEDVAAAFAANREAGLFACGFPRPLEVADADVLLGGFHIRSAAGPVEHARAEWAAAVLETCVQDEEGTSGKLQHMGLMLLGGRRLPGEDPACGVEVRPCGARELLLAGAAEVGKLEEVAQLGRREVLVDGLEGIPREVATTRA